MIGKNIRLERIINRNTGKAVIIPMDHGLTVGPIKGLENMKNTINAVANGGANAIILHKGIVINGHRKKGKDIGLIIHLSGSTSLSSDPNAKVLVCSVEEAIRLGADAVSIHINIGAESESKMLEDFGAISKKCMDWGMPLLAMIYTRGKKIKNENEVEVVKHAARVAAEMGADIVKVSYTGSESSFKQVVKGCPIPVMIAGGETQANERDFLECVYSAIRAGASGVTIGRNAFSHKNPAKMTAAICAIVHQKKSVNEALKLLD
ncbi:MAG TPA: 2-amino-3,7-dideoxy-D-threo-hept-6-ulosonate synthase [bacterium]|nr:2-amino-3,7-dideoxy-D-threo-hept-6-ulosonate synthase [bacterium]HPP87642.1 2-amino-3,7-dideoxy-D-threo-hept-6-ulosonate synthase [bacterium]